MAGEEKVIDMLLGFLKDKHIALAQTSTSLGKIDTIRRGLGVLQKSLETADPDKINFHKTALTLTKSMLEVADLTYQNSICLLMYMSVGDFDIDSAKLLTKLGKGKEALQQMWKNKMEGKG